MSVRLIATIEVRASAFSTFMSVMGEVQAAAEGAGWKLEAAYIHKTGALNTVIDVWALDDLNHLDVGMAALAKHPRFPEIRAALAESIVKETLTFADALAYPPPKER